MAPVAGGSPRTTGSESTGRRDLLHLVTIHSFTWLTAGNAVGLLLASLLLVPGLGVWLGPLTYGRWMPLHLDLQFYGWCTLPLIALLYRIYLPDPPGRLPTLAVGLWSGGLLFSAISWLTGHASGKLYLDWAGTARWVLATSLAVLATSFLVAYGRDVARYRGEPTARRASRRSGLLWRGAGILLLLPAPFLLFFATSPRVYQPVNPAGGGATHTSTLGSVLGVILILLLLPRLMRLQPTRSGISTRGLAWFLALQFLLFAALDHGDVSHHEPLQWLSLATLLPWGPLLAAYYRRFSWPAGSRGWLGAMAAWAAVLLLTGMFAAVPGGQELWKFTNALVGHVHAALAGLVSCWLMLLLLTLGRLEDSRQLALFSDRAAFWAWQLGCGLQVTALLLLGTFEGLDPLLLTARGGGVLVAYGCRWLGGLAMLVASVRWLGAAVRLAAAARTFSHSEPTFSQLTLAETSAYATSPRLPSSPSLLPRRRIG